MTTTPEPTGETMRTAESRASRAYLESLMPGRRVLIADRRGLHESCVTRVDDHFIHATLEQTLDGSVRFFRATGNSGLPLGAVPRLVTPDHWRWRTGEPPPEVQEVDMQGRHGLVDHARRKDGGWSVEHYGRGTSWYGLWHGWQWAELPVSSHPTSA